MYSESVTESGLNTCLCQPVLALVTFKIKHRLERLDNLNYLARAS